MLTRRISVRGLIDDADPSLNVILTGGEEIRVPEVSKIYVMGNVKKPGAFPVQDGSETTIMEILALAEGLMPFSGSQAFIYRREAKGPKNEIPVPLDKIMKRQAPDVTLTANDILYIPDNHGKRLGIARPRKNSSVRRHCRGATALILLQLRPDMTQSKETQCAPSLFTMEFSPNRFRRFLNTS